MDRIEFRKTIYKITKEEKWFRDNKDINKIRINEKNCDKNKDEVIFFPAVNKDMIIRKNYNNEELNFILLDGKISINKQFRFMEVPKHRHDYIGINFIYSGEAKLIIENKTINISKGDICIMDSGVIHAISELGEEDIVFNIQIDPDYFTNNILFRFKSGEDITNFIVNALTQWGESEQIYLIKMGRNSKIFTLIEDIFLEAIEPGLCSDEYINNLIELIFIEMMRSYTPESKIIDKKNKNDSIVEILKYIEDNINDITLSKLSDKFNFTANYISKLIKNKTGKSFKYLHEEYKMEKVLFLLKNSALSIETIARDCGYSNINFFYNKFKDKYKMTPAEYRNIKKE